MPSASRSLVIEWRPRVAQLAPMACVLVPSLAAAVFSHAPAWVSWLLIASSAIVVGTELSRFARRARAQILVFEGDGLAVEGRRERIRSTWTAGAWSVLRLRSNRGSRRLLIHRSEVGPVAFARLRRHLIATVPYVAPLWPRRVRPQRPRSTSR